MYVCICARVRECEVRRAVRAGAHTEDAVGDACRAGTGCGSCLDRIGEIIDGELAGTAPASSGVGGVGLAGVGLAGAGIGAIGETPKRFLAALA